MGPKNERQSSTPDASGHDGMRPSSMVEHHIPRSAPKAFAESLSRPQQRPWPTKPHRAEHDHFVSGSPQFVGKSTFKVQRESPLDLWAEQTRTSQRGQERFNSPIKISRIHIENA